MNAIVLDLFTSMTAFLIEPCRQKESPYREGNDVREIFYKHWEKMKKKRTRTIDEIQEWRDSTIEKIKRYAQEQIRILDDDYDRQRVIFGEQRKKKLDEMYDPAISKQSDIRGQILETCHSLKFKVAKLERFKGEIEYVVVNTVEAQIKAKAERRINQRSPQSVNSEERSEKNADANSNGDSIATNRVNTHDRPLTTVSANRNRQSNDSHSSPRPEAKSSDDVFRSCPICLMIFPIVMSTHDRREHINEHYADDESAPFTM